MPETHPQAFQIAGLLLQQHSYVYSIRDKPSISDVADALQEWGRQMIAEHEAKYHCGVNVESLIGEESLHTRITSISWEGNGKTRYAIIRAICDHHSKTPESPINPILADLLRLTHGEVLMTKGVGARTMKHIQSTLEKLGIIWLSQGGYRKLEPKKEEADASPTM